MVLVTINWTLFNCFLDTVGIDNIFKIHNLNETTNIMKKLLLVLLFIPLVLFSQSKYDSIQITSLDAYGFSVAGSKQKDLYYGKIIDKSYYYRGSRENFNGTRENLVSGKMEKNYDLNGTLREELFISNSFLFKSYLKLFNEWGKLKVEISLNENGFKDGIETFWQNEFNDYKPDPPLWKKRQKIFSNGNFISEKFFKYKTDVVESELTVLNDHTESTSLHETTIDIRFYLRKVYAMDGKNRMEQTYSRIYKNGEFTGLHGTNGKAGKDREWWANGNLKKEVNYQNIEIIKDEFIIYSTTNNNSRFYLNNDKVGFSREWDERGELLLEKYFEKNLLKTFKSFYESGNLKEEKLNDYETNEMVLKKYFENGNLKEKEKSNNKIITKELSKYSEGGILILYENYDNFKLTTRSKFDSSGKPIFKFENGITYYLGNKVLERNNNATKSYFKNGQLASLTLSNDSLYKKTRWLISGEKEFEKVYNHTNNTGNIKIWKNKKLVHDINLFKGSVIENSKNKIETNNFLNYSRESSGVVYSLKINSNRASYGQDGRETEDDKEIEIFNSPYGEKIGEFNDYLSYFSEYQYDYEEYGIEFYDHINGHLEIGPSLWINDDVVFSSWLKMTQYGNAWAPGLVLRSKPEKNSEKIIAFQGESYHVSLIGEFINGYSKVRVDFYEEDPCEGGSVKKSWEGWAKIIDDFGKPNIDYPPRGC